MIKDDKKRGENNNVSNCFVATLISFFFSFIMRFNINRVSSVLMLSWRISYYMQKDKKQQQQQQNTMVFDQLDIYKGKLGSGNIVVDLSFINRASAE